MEHCNLVAVRSHYVVDFRGWETRSSLQTGTPAIQKRRFEKASVTLPARAANSRRVAFSSRPVSGEPFVGCQLIAQKARPDKFVDSKRYGECWPGYIPSASHIGDNFEGS